MLSISKRVRKFIHYYQTDLNFKKVFNGGVSAYKHLLKELNQYTDLQASYDEVRLFYCGIHGHTHVRNTYIGYVEIVFYDAGVACNAKCK